jgi:hypothetical protein
MQSAKDTFFLALRDRLAAMAPERTVIVDGAARPAVLVAENEATTSAPPLPRAFYLHFGECGVVDSDASAPQPLRALQCEIAYRTGFESGDSYARGRSLGALDQELLCLCSPPRTPKVDPTLAPPALATTVFWSGITFPAPEDTGSELRRRAQLSIFFYTENEP